MKGRIAVLALFALALVLGLPLSAMGIAHEPVKVWDMGGESTAVFVVLDHHPTSVDLERMAHLDGVWVSYVSKYMDVVCLRNVAERQMDVIAHMPGVVKVEEQARYYPNLDISARALRARPSTTYANTVWDDLGITGSGVGVAIIDSGVDDGHEALQGKYVAGVDFSHPGVIVYTNPDDVAGHGTHVAGIVMSDGGSDGVYKGVAPGANLIDLKVINNMGDTWADTVMEALEWCIGNKTEYNIRVINLSLGSRTGSDGTDVQSEMINTVVDNGIIVVAAMGNDGQYGLVPTPGAADKAIAVGATTDLSTVGREDDYVDSYSNSGPRPNDGDTDPYDELKPDVVAPGTNITSCMYSLTTQNGAGYIAFDGTSMATPHISGVCALMMEANPNLTPAMVKEILHETAEARGTPYDPALSPKYNVTYGYGIADAYGAVKRALNLRSGAIDVVGECETRQTVRANVTMSYTRTPYIVGNERPSMTVHVPGEWGRPSNIEATADTDMNYESGIRPPARDSNGDWYFTVDFYFNTTVNDIENAGLRLSFTTTAPFATGTYNIWAEHMINTLRGDNSTATVEVKQGNEKPDLSVTRGGITFSPESPQDGDTVTISARINNTGTVGTTADIGFYDGLPSSSTLIDTDTVYVSAGSYSYASVEWGATAGLHTIYVVCDPDNNVDESNEYNNTASKTIEVGGTNIPPVAVLKVNKNQVAKGESVEFDGSQSYDLNGQVSEYFFDFGDGTDSGWTTQSIVTHAYDTEGAYTASLKVKDNGGAESTNNARANITVTRGHTITYYLAPQFELTETAPSTHTANEINCPQGNVGPVGGLLEWKEVGTWSKSLSPRTIIEDIPVHLWVIKRSNDLMTTLRIRATALLNGNAITSTDTSILPIIQANQSTMVNLTLKLNQETAVENNDVLGLKIECLTDSSSVYLQYYSMDQPSGMDVTAEIPSLKPPHADCGNDKSGYTGEPITFDASHSYDPDGSIVQYKWDFNGDGEWDHIDTDPVATETYTKEGVYNVTLMVVDNDGLTDTDTCKVTVTKRPENKKPTVAITEPENGTTVSGTLIIKGTASDEDGSVKRVEVSIGSGPWEAATGTDDWSYTWDTEKSSNGLHQIRARAYDGKDYSDIVSIEVKVSNVNSPPSILDSTIDPVIVDNQGSSVVTVSAKVKDANGRRDIKGVYCDLSALGLEDKRSMNDNGMEGDVTPNDDVYTTQFVVPTGVMPGTKSIKIWAEDSAGGMDQVYKNLTILAYNNPPKILSSGVEPEKVSNSGEDTIVLMVEVEDPDGVGDIKGVYADLSSLKSSRSQWELRDDGSGGDETAGDGVYSLQYRVPFTVDPGEYTIPVYVEDKGGKRAYDNITIRVVEAEGGGGGGGGSVGAKGFIPSFELPMSVLAVLTVAGMMYLGRKHRRGG